MGFRWKDSIKGGLNGFKAGSRGGPIGMIAGTVGGAALGGYGKDIDKKVTGNSQSGMTSGLIETAGNMGGGGGGSSAAGIGGNLFSRFSGGDDVEEGYENNPAVLARQNKSSAPGNNYMGGIMNLFNRGGSRGSISMPGESEDAGGGMDMMTLLNLLKMSKGM